MTAGAGIECREQIKNAADFGEQTLLGADSF
jgi:hypothetical protein